MDIEAELLKSMEKKELEQAIEEKIESFHGFLTREVALRLIAKEKGLLKEKEKTFKIAEIPKGTRKISFKAHVKKIWPVATYSSGKCSQVIEVEDETGKKPLILWNKDTELAKNLRVKDEITVKGAYERSGELHLSYNGKIEIKNKAAFSELNLLEDDETVHIRGIISKIEGYDRFVRNENPKMGYSFIITDGKTERRVIILEGSDRGEKLKQGDEIVIEGARVRRGDIDLDSVSRIKTRRKGEMLLGEIKKMECEGGNLSLEIGERTVMLDRQNALKLMNVDMAEDIQLSTVVGLKKEMLLNSRIAVKIEERNGQILIRG